ncbi:MAG: hypothetical protein J1F61_06110, partial [Clostridiales bacterium]|nr:hypothetical protein [Clostridiales bacterium]
MKFKNILIFLITAVLSLCMLFSLAACKDDGTANNNPGSGTQQSSGDPVQLVAPHISLNQSTGV